MSEMVKSTLETAVIMSAAPVLDAAIPLPAKRNRAVKGFAKPRNRKNKIAAPKPSWQSTKKPDEAKFYVSNEIWEAILYCMSQGKNVLLTGPSGCGKSELCYLASEALSTPISAFNMGAMSEPRLSLIGATHFNREKGTWFNESRFIRAVVADKGTVLLDEITRCERAAFNILLPLLDRQGYLALDESEDAAIIRKGGNVCFAATANIGMEYTGTDDMDKALKDRFDLVIDMFFPPDAAEANVLKARCPGLQSATASRLINIATKQRAMTVEGDFITMISTRMLLAAGAAISKGMDFDLACKLAIVNHFNREGKSASEQTKVLQIIQKGAC